MGKSYEQISPALAKWIAAQHLFFVATAPLAADGLINCSPKGMDTFRVLGPRSVAYLDLTGSGVETIAHLRENGRIVFTFCALHGPPKIVRLHGRGEVLMPDHPDFDGLIAMFPEYPGVRSIIRAELLRVGDSCGYAVPRYHYVEDRDTLERWAERKGPEGIVAYREEKNGRSVDGLPGLVS
jgi:hypothetical protein